MLPYFDQGPLFKQINFGNSPRPWEPYPAWGAELPWLLCPSDSPPPRSISDNGQGGRNNYKASLGTTIRDNQRLQRTSGIFAYQGSTSLAHVTDGTSQTIALAEMVQGSDFDRRAVKGNVAYLVSGIDTNPQNCQWLNQGGRLPFGQAVNPINWFPGLRWNDGAPNYSGFGTVLAPNQPSCIPSDWDHDWALMTASSYHTGGVHVLMADGAVRFISDNINAGDISNGFGVWGALGTRSGREPIGEY